MSWAKYLSFIPAAVFFPTVLTLMFLNWRERRLRRRLRWNRSAAINQAAASATSQSDALEPDAPEPVSGGYTAELAAALADLREEPAPHSALGKRNSS